MVRLSFRILFSSKTTSFWSLFGLQNPSKTSSKIRPVFLMPFFQLFETFWLQKGYPKFVRGYPIWLPKSGPKRDLVFWSLFGPLWAPFGLIFATLGLKIVPQASKKRFKLRFSAIDMALGSTTAQNAEDLPRASRELMPYKLPSP